MDQVDGAEGEGGAPFLERLRIEDKDNTPVTGDVNEAAADYVLDRADLMEGLSANDQFAVKSKSESNSFRHVRMDQTFKGLRIHGADIVVHANRSSFQSLNGAVVRGLAGFDTSPVVAEAEALELSKANYAAQVKEAGAQLAYDREEAELLIYPVSDNNLRLAWHVKFYTELQAGMEPGLWSYFVDAKTGDILAKVNNIHTLSQASGPGGNPKVPRTWVEALDVEGSGTQFSMDTARLITVNMRNATSGNGTVVTGPLDNIGDAAINDAHGYAEATLNMMQEWFGHNSINDNGFKIRSRVHYGRNYENAFWDGQQMTYGDGASLFYPLSGAVDVVAHEINHGFTTFHSNLTYSGQSGGLNESFSDIAGIAAKFYLDPARANFDLGGDVFRAANEALRYMCDPPRDGRSIGHASNYTSGMDVHFSSGVSNKAFCRAAKRLASGSPDGTATPESVRRAAAAWYKANADFWTSSTNFQQGCQGVVDAAGALGFSAAERKHLIDSWADVGVFCSGASQPVQCDQTLTAENGTLTSPNYPQNYGNNARITWCIQPTSGKPTTLTFSSFDTEQGYDFVEIKDANGAQVARTSGTAAPSPATSSILYVTFTSDGSVVRKGFEARWSTGSATNQAPTASITAPTTGASVSGQVTISADAQDSDGSIARVEFFLPDGTTQEVTAAPYRLTWDSTKVANGQKVISVVAYDNLGAASAESAVTVNVSNVGGTCLDGVFTAQGLPASIPDNSTTGISSVIAVSGSGTIESLRLSLNITHTYRGDILVTLTSPAGTSYTAHNRTGGSADNLVITDFGVSNFRGEQAAGNWTLSVSDRASRDTGSLTAFSLNIKAQCQ